MRASTLMAYLAAGLLAGACSPASDRSGEAFRANGRVVAFGGGDAGAQGACFRCHGLEGQGDGAGSPRLAGLDAGYLQKQLEDYAVRIRADDVMSPIARRLTAADRRAVAAWYAAMPPAAPPSIPPPAAWNRSCAACHGPAGQGLGPGNPALAGQPDAYTLEQLRRWIGGRRRNDPGRVMHAAALKLSPADARAIAAWLSPPPPSPASASAAASGSAGASAWR